MSNRKFEVVSKYKDQNIILPTRGTKCSAGYDFYAAEDCVIPSYLKLLASYNRLDGVEGLYDLKSHKDLVKITGIKSTLVPTGVKALLNEDEELELRSRSSVSTNNLLFLINGVGTVDADYYNNLDNEGHIMVPLFNLSPFDVKINKGDKIAQGLIKKYLTIDDEDVANVRQGGFGSTGEK